MSVAGQVAKTHERANEAIRAAERRAEIATDIQRVGWEEFDRQRELLDEWRRAGAAFSALKIEYLLTLMQEGPGPGALPTTAHRAGIPTATVRSWRMRDGMFRALTDALAGGLPYAERYWARLAKNDATSRELAQRFAERWPRFELQYTRFRSPAARTGAFLSRDLYSMDRASVDIPVFEPEDVAELYRIAAAHHICGPQCTEPHRI